MEVWVAQTWNAHGDGQCVFGVYESREAAFEGLKTLPNMTVYVDEAGHVRGRPVKQGLGNIWSPVHLGMTWEPVKWALAKPMEVLSRQPAATQAQ